MAGSTNEELAVMLIGKTGEGKSDTGNTIVGIDDAFDSNDSSVSVTTKPKKVEGVNLGRQLAVVDTPGCMDTKIGDEILDEIARAVYKHTDGYDAFLIVLKYPVRWTEEAKNSISQLEKLFGKDFYQYSILVMTHGDSFKQKQMKLKKKNEDVTFEQYLKQQEEVSVGEGSIGEIIKLIEHRAVLFNNMANDDEKEEMLGELFQMIEKVRMSRKGPFTNKIFKKAKEEEKDNSKSEEEKVESLVGYMQKVLNWALSWMGSK